MSESEDRELEELQRRLDAAFATTRPRRAFPDELWGRLQARTPSWRRRPAIGAWPALGGLAAVLVVGLVLAGVLANGIPGRSATTAGRGAPQATEGAAPAGSDASRAVGPQQPSAATPAGAGALPFGPLPRPRSAGVPQVLQGAPLPLAGARWQDATAQPPAPGPDLPVYRYDAGSGPPDGAILERGSVPAGLPAASYPARDFAGAFLDAAGRAAASAPAGPQPDLTLSEARIVYVAVVSGGQGYLEPAYLLTGTALAGGRSATARVLVPALAASVLR